MKQKISILFVCCFITVILFAQKQTFDIATYNMPKGWTIQAKESVVQLAKEEASGAFCLITLYKSLPSGNEAKKNFVASWEALVKDQLDIKTDPEMQPPAAEDGWEVHSGHAAFDKDGIKGVALLVSSTGHDKVVNILIMTNTDAFEKDVTAFLESIDLMKTSESPDQQNTGNVTLPITTNSPTGATPAIKSQFKYNTTNFDDGWTATEQEDWVEVTKGNARILIHYPNPKADEYNPRLLDGLKNAWDILVAPRYSSASGMQFRPISYWEAIEYAEATMVEKTTGKSVYVVLFKKNYSGGRGKYMEFITPDKTAFEQQFGAYREEPLGWDKMEVMLNYNRFAVALTDLTGKWTSNFTGIQQYVNAYTGTSAGMNTYSSVQTFQFGKGNTYKWELTVASGFVGDIKFQNTKSNGKFSMSGNWQVNFSDISGQPRNYPAQFTCIKGARILWLDGTAYAKAE